MRKALFSIVLLFAAGLAYATNFFTATVFSAVTAGADHTLASVDVQAVENSSWQVVWSGLTGTIDGTVKLQISNDNTNWNDKTGATLTLSGAAGADSISVNGAVTERYYRAVYAHTSITGGTVTLVMCGKHGG